MPKKDRPWEPAGQAGVLPLTWARVGEDFTLRSGVYTTLLAKDSVKIVLFLAGLLSGLYCLVLTDYFQRIVTRNEG